MDRYVVIGNPVAHSLSPAIHAQFARILGERIDYSTLLVPRESFAQHAESFFAGGGSGANITLPFKVEALAFAHTRSERADLAGAANFLAAREGSIHADNTDGAGLVSDLLGHHGVRLKDASILLIGAGGAARGVVAPLLAQGPARIVIANRSPQRATELVTRFAHLGRIEAAALPDIPAVAFDVVINATASSTRGERLELPARAIPRGSFAYDMAYGSAALPFLERARAAGARAVDGLGMLVEQAAESYALWRGRRPPTAPVLAALRARA